MLDVETEAIDLVEVGAMDVTLTEEVPAEDKAYKSSAATKYSTFTDPGQSKELEGTLEALASDFEQHTKTFVCVPDSSAEKEAKEQCRKFARVREEFEAKLDHLDDERARILLKRARKLFSHILAQRLASLPSIEQTLARLEEPEGYESSAEGSPIERTAALKMSSASNRANLMFKLQATIAELDADIKRSVYLISMQKASLSRWSSEKEVENYDNASRDRYFKTNELMEEVKEVGDEGIPEAGQEPRRCQRIGARRGSAADQGTVGVRFKLMQAGYRSVKTVDRGGSLVFNITNETMAEKKGPGVLGPSETVAEDEWGFATPSNDTADQTPQSFQHSLEEDEWGFSTNKTSGAAPKPNKLDDEEDDWGFPVDNTGEVAPKPDKPFEEEDEWGFAINGTNQTAENEASDLLKKWGFDSEPPSPTAASKPSDDSPGAAESLFEGWKTATRTGNVGTSLSTFITILSSLDISGPEHLLMFSLKEKAVKIGQGSQFTVFLDASAAIQDDHSGKIVEGKGKVVKRVRISKMALKNDEDLGSNEQYLQTLRHLELEVLSLGLLRHRNIVRLLGWGYDYEDRYTPIPILFMEAALAPLDEFLLSEKKGEGPLVALGAKRWDVKYHFALDVAAGLEAIHGLNIVHGDVKPENVLVFRHDDLKIPYVAKLSDFGVCVDMRVDGQRVTPESYLGTTSWTGSEVGVGQWNDDVHGIFTPELLKNFDSYSFGLLLLSIFGAYGGLPEITKEPGPQRGFGLSMEIGDSLKTAKGCPEDILMQVKAASKKLLAIKPGERPPPSPVLLRTELPAYLEWLQESTSVQQTQQRKRRGHAYWSSLDMHVLRSLDQQYTQQEKRGKSGGFSGESLFGMTEACSQQPIEGSADKILKYILASAKKGYVPARAICAKVYEAFDRRIDVDEKTLMQWEKEAVLDGFMFYRHPFLEEERHEEQRQQFRRNGGYCDDAFLGMAPILATARDVNRLATWLRKFSIDYAVDSIGNTMMHACAALGEIDSVRILLDKSNAELVNENEETPLYKACQAGHTAVVLLLLRNGHRATPTKDMSISPLHWLFNFPESDIPQIADALAKSGGVDVNHMIKPPRYYGRTPRYLMKHFPFEFPLGSPFHWAAFARNKTALDVLLNLGANIDATYDNENHGTTPLAQAVCTEDAPLVAYLLGKGADISVKNKEGRNPLHLMSLGAGNDHVLSSGKWDSWVRHGSWGKSVQSAKDVVHLLVKAGVDIEGRTNTWGKRTPLLTASDPIYRKEHVVQALLDEGANAEAKTERSEENVLHLWCSTDPSLLRYPHMYKSLFAYMIEKVNDLDSQAGALEETVLHEMVKTQMPAEKLFEYIELLFADPKHSPNINARNRDGNTPLMVACLGLPKDIVERIRFLLKHGARPSDMNDSQENFILRLVENYTLMDADSLSALQLLFSHESFTPDVLRKFINETSFTALTKCAAEGRLRTLSYLLQLGMDARVNEKVTIRGTETTTLDEAFFSANSARFVYIGHASELLTKEEIEEADQKNRLYTTNAGVVGRYGGASAARAREAYWAYPEIFALLQSHGGLRIRQAEHRGPSWRDVIDLPMLGMTKDTQPNLDHWRTLYDLEELDDGWEEAAYEEFKDQHSYLDEDDLETLEVPILAFEQWPRLVEMLSGKDGWYRGILRDGRSVEVKMDAKTPGGIEQVRDLKGRKLSVPELLKRGY
ncbi:ankyrin [Mytilinidion resinicola]|uniref:Ankyrin n=1 Tax=Mytilinidion resinicola TaxID=574789 RepID=A0A6A6YAC2_9PEZI|nr:ankyrin [Mytilinidion resinicola]KAF2805772.1 ankyrin [Mytilinidion resinicola]